jgi:hypothetical protein
MALKRNRSVKKKKARELIRGGSVPVGSAKLDQTVSGNGLGIPTFHRGDVTVPSGVDDQGADVPWFRIGRLMGVIIVLAIGWICVVAWMIHMLPS